MSRADGGKGGVAVNNQAYCRPPEGSEKELVVLGVLSCVTFFSPSPSLPYLTLLFFFPPRHHLPLSSSAF